MAGRIAYYGGVAPNGLIFHIDAARRNSYSGIGTAWNDLSGFNYHGSLVNGPVFNSNDRGGSITFDAVNDYATFPNPLFNLYSGSNNTQQVWTVNAWVNLPSATSGVVLVNGYNSPNGINLGLYLAFYTGGAGPTYYLNWASSARFLYGGQNKIIGRGPTNVTFTLNCPANSMVNYINGAVDTTYTSPAFTPAGISQNMFIAGPGNAAAYSLYYLQIYNRALSAAEVLQNYNATKGRYGL
jgi:hypothetical protein